MPLFLLNLRTIEAIAGSFSIHICKSRALGLTIGHLLEGNSYVVTVVIDVRETNIR